MNEKYAVVTGATSGIGLQIARGIAATGYNTIIVARDQEKARLARQEIESVSTGNTRVHIEIADLASLDSIEALATRIISQFPQTSLLVNNAGIIVLKKKLSKDGIEMNLAVNHLAPFLLTWRLLPLLRQHPGARVVNVNSNAHEKAKLQESDLEPTSLFDSMGAYGQSKLASMFTTLELARLVPPAEVTFNAVHPGMVATNIGKVGGLMELIGILLRPFMLTPKKGADTALWASTAPELAGVTGRYYEKRAESQTNPLLQDAHLAKVVWQKTLKMARLNEFQLLPQPFQPVG
jgi:NAD(P)-dependent dehydrogenase (short-subunit alcohol dehydrogenase family)